MSLMFVFLFLLQPSHHHHHSKMLVTSLCTCHEATMMVTMWVFLCLSLSNAALIDENVPIEQVCPGPPDRHLFLFLTPGDQCSGSVWVVIWQQIMTSIQWTHTPKTCMYITNKTHICTSSFLDSNALHTFLLSPLLFVVVDMTRYLKAF